MVEALDKVNMKVNMCRCRCRCCCGVQTCDAFGVLPPVSKLSASQVMYHFISGYTSKMAGTEIGILKPAATFSACYGSPFLAMHPMVYAEMLVRQYLSI